MEKIAVLFPSADTNATCPHPSWLAEIAACENTPLFFPILYNEDAFAKGNSLRVSSPAPSKTTYCIRRGRRFRNSSWRDGKGIEIEHALKRFGYREAFKHTDRHYWYSEYDYPTDEYDIRNYVPESVAPYERHWQLLPHWFKAPEEYVWSPSLHTFRSLLPAVAKNDEHTFCHSDGTPVILQEFTTWGAVDRVILHMSDCPIEEITETRRHAPMWFQRYVEIAKANDGTPVEWRIFFLEGRIVVALPKYQPSDDIELSEPPEEMLAPFRESRCFRAVDYALDVNGRWWVLRSQAGEAATVPKGTARTCLTNVTKAALEDGFITTSRNEELFYRRLAEEIERGADLPKWCWCLVANIVGSHALGKDKVTVAGSRHFAAGTKVVFTDAYWGQGGERCTVLGVPKYSDQLVGVTLNTELLENFRCERTEDAAVIRALATNRLKEPFERERATHVRGGYELWGQSNEIRQKIEEEADYMNSWLPLGTV